MERKVSYKKNENNVIYVGNLPKQLSEEQLKTYFNQFGDVIKIRLMKSKKTNGSRGYAFVQFEDHEIAKIAAETMDKYIIDGKSLKVHVKEGDQIVKHLFKRGKKISVKKNKVKLINNKLELMSRNFETKLENILDSIKNGNKHDSHEEIKSFIDKLSAKVEKLKDKQKRFDTDLYNGQIEVYSKALITLKNHINS
ncbi:nucleolar phosphoprotein (Nopp34) [Theileria annulata]|uniref:Nucleolar phosphoprotein (Nopp34 homologue), putative n=1 Tax=Theileria annulata TaxID=5874 RepID=Q4UIM5_THEAN|nr:nucleolar phosphoprotein (Nopp34) [Theileria annulata]CAI73064.1 nucleolar phosphoprotein (Nopp34 homologue), putative [Theileria annulata]|eukprot:XP_953742.1 nucleolar phosphoprotein (Nopp34 homologue), putative [Theileria annulata]